METFVGDTIKISVNTETDLSVFTNLYIKYRKPDLTTGKWTSTICPANHECMTYTADGNDIDQSGEWAVQAYVTTPTKAYNGKWDTFKVFDPITTVPPTTAAPTTLVPTTI